MENNQHNNAEVKMQFESVEDRNIWLKKYFPGVYNEIGHLERTHYILSDRSEMFVGLKFIDHLFPRI